MDFSSLSDAADVLTNFAFLALVQSTLLILLAFALIALFRVRCAAMLSATYRYVLVGVIAAPPITLALTSFQVAGFWPATWSNSPPRPGSSNIPDSSGIHSLVGGAPVSPTLNVGDREASAQLALPPGRMGLPGEMELRQEAIRQHPEVEDSVATSPVPVPDRSLSAGSPPVTGSYWQTMKLSLAAIWIGATLILITRLFFSHRALWRTLRHARPVDGSVQELCNRLAKDLHVCSPRVVHSPYFTSPFLAGGIKPVIHLPSQPNEDLMQVGGAELRDVLIHELAHLKRNDSMLRVVQRIVLALFFFQPLLWRLVRRLENAAEDVCDDYAVRFGADRKQYASCLVGLAEQCDFPIASAVGIASRSSLLKHRVMRIMDAGRELSIQASRRYLAAVGLGITVLVWGLGLLMAPASPAVAQPPTPPQDRPKMDKQVDQSAISAEAAKADALRDATPTDKTIDETLSSIRGTIRGSSGPLAGAEVAWWRSRVHDIEPMEPIRAVTDEKGQFELTRIAPNPADPAIWDMREEMAIRAPGHGFRRTSPFEFTRQAKRTSGLAGILSSLTGGSSGTFHLSPEGRPIRGHLVDIDGQPIQGARVRIRWFTEGMKRTPGDTEQEIENKRIRAVSNLVNVIEQVPLRDALPTATTDAEGRFELKGLPDHSLFELLVERPGFESTNLIVRNYGADEVVTVPQKQGYRHNPSSKMYPAKFQAVMGPSRTVSGTVTNLATRQPIAGALVRAIGVHGQRVTSSRERQHFATRTDAQGRYEIAGLPIGSGNRLEVFTTGDVPYVPAGSGVDTSKTSGGDTQVIQDFQLKIGIWAEGRVYEQATGEPFQGEISYYWFRNRDLEAEYPGVLRTRLDGRYLTDEDGQYRVPVLPTAGVIAFSTGNRDHTRMAPYPRGYGEHELQSYRRPDGSFPYYDTAPYSLMPGNYNRLALVEPEPGQEAVHVDLPLLASQPIPVAIFAPDGTRADGEMEIYGGNERWGWQDQAARSFVVEDLLPDQRRKVFAFDRKQNLVGGTLVDHEPGKIFEIHLAPAGSVRGRLLDVDGQPMTDATLTVEYEDFQNDDTTGMWARQIGKNYMPNQLTLDEQGRFEVFGLSAQWKYSARVSHEARIVGYPFRDLVLEPGEDRDLGDIEIPER